MKTSASQFDLLVTFMEQHGDLSKPSSNARGRISCMKHWEELIEMLNSDGSGDKKSTEKWKKVWSDYKNNTKRKAARLHRAASGTGGGPAVFTKLTDLEQRVLNLVGVQVATGLAVEEAGVSQEIPIQSCEQNLNRLQTQSQVLEFPIPASVVSVVPSQPPTPTKQLSPQPLIFIEEEFQICDEPQPSTSGLAPTTTRLTPRPSSATATNLSCEIEMEDMGTLPPRRTSQVRVSPPEPAQSGQTTPRRVRAHTLSQRSPRRRPRLAHTDVAAQHFLQAEEFWRKFKAQQHKDYMDLKREQLESQKQWQAIGSRALDILDKLVNKYCKD